MTRWRLLAPHVEGGVPLARIAEHSGVGERTLQRWAARYRSDWPGWPEPDGLTGDSGGFPPICGC